MNSSILLKKKSSMNLKIYMKTKIESLDIASTYFSEIWYRIHSENNFLFINHYKIFYSIQIKPHRILWIEALK